MKRKTKKPTIKEMQKDLQTLFNIVSSINYTTDTLRMLIENYLEMKKETEKLAKYMEAKTEKLKNEVEENTRMAEEGDSEQAT
jgi:predicted membrane chloride channel (bestrophin family)